MIQYIRNRFRRGTQAKVVAVTTALEGEPYYATDTKQLYIGDGTSHPVWIGPPEYGSLYADDIAQLVTIGASGAYVKVPGGLTAGACNGFTLASSRELTCAVAGKYLVHWSMSLESTNNNEELAGCVMINTTHDSSTEAEAEVINGAKPVCVSGTGIITLSVNDVVALCVENETAAHNITVTHANLSVVRIGT